MSSGGSITAAIIALCVYFGLLSLFIGSFSAMLSPSEAAYLNMPGWRIPSFIDAGPTSETMDYVSTQTCPTVRAGDCYYNSTYGACTNSSGLNQFFFTTSSDQYNLRTNNYTIHNTNNVPFKLFIQASHDPIMGFLGQINTIEVQVDTTGYHIYEGWAGITHRLCCEIIDTGDPTTYDDQIIQTYYKVDPTQYGVGSSGNYHGWQVGVKVFDPAKGSVYCECEGMINQEYTGGWEVNGEDFCVSSVTSNVENYPEASPYHSGILGSLEAAGDTLLQAIKFVTFMLGMIALPWGIGSGDIALAVVDVLFFKIPLFAIPVLVIAWLKPSGGT